MQMTCKEVRDTFPLWTLMFLQAAVSCSAVQGDFRMISPSQPVIAVPGDDVILPCQLDPPSDVEKFVVEWSRPGPPGQSWPDIVHLYQNMKEAPERHLSYVNRTHLFTEELKHGNLSLKIKNVTSADAGRYRCDLPNLMRNLIVHLFVVEIKMITSSQPIVAAPGDDVILPCRLDPPLDAHDLIVEWSKPDLKPKPSESWAYYVHLHQYRREVLDLKLPSYVNRTQLFTEKLKHGNISLKILNVTPEDEGRYRSFIPKLKAHSVVQLVVVDHTRRIIWTLSVVCCCFSLLVLAALVARYLLIPPKQNVVSHGVTSTARSNIYRCLWS